MNTHDEIKRFSLRLPDDVHEDIIREAEREDRSINNMIIQLLREALAARRAAPTS